MEQIISEGNAKIYGELKQVVTRDMVVFYNPVMRVNRDATILVLSAIDNVDMKIADPLAGTGVRSLRMLNELDEKKVKKIFVNDKKYKFEEYFKKNIELNKFEDNKKEKLVVENFDANIFLLKNKIFDYIDIDPFGTPNTFLDAATQTIKNKGILAVTATDTSALCGSYPTACKRKYYATPLRNELMHEFGLRILVRKVQLIGAQHDKALTPIFSYAKDHYMKIFFICFTGKTKVDEILAQHIEFIVEDKKYGPIWSGLLWDEILVGKMLKLLENEDFAKNIHNDTKKLVAIINNECKIKTPFFFDMHELSRKKKTGNTPNFEKMIERLKSKGFLASRTHFSVTGIKTNADEKTFEQCFEEEMK